jgi:hypothetical protein
VDQVDPDPAPQHCLSEKNPGEIYAFFLFLKRPFLSLPEYGSKETYRL